MLKKPSLFAHIFQELQHSLLQLAQLNSIDTLLTRLRVATRRGVVTQRNMTTRRSETVSPRWLSRLVTTTDESAINTKERHTELLQLGRHGSHHFIARLIDLDIVRFEFLTVFLGSLRLSAWRTVVKAKD